MPDPHAPSPDALDAALDELYKLADHDCGYVLRPDTGYCEFHEKWFAARAAVRRLAEQGEHGWAIALDTPIGSGHMHVRPSDTEWELHAYGCRVTGVRVTRIEEAP